MLATILFAAAIGLGSNLGQQSQTAATATPPAPPAAPSQSASRTQRAPEPMICETRPRTGGRIDRRICRSRSQVQATHSAAQQYVQEIQKPMASDALPSPY